MSTSEWIAMAFLMITAGVASFLVGTRLRNQRRPRPFKLDPRVVGRFDRIVTSVDFAGHDFVRARLKTLPTDPPTSKT